jgi:hypothetical protein
MEGRMKRKTGATFTRGNGDRSVLASSEPRRLLPAAAPLRALLLSLAATSVAAAGCARDRHETIRGDEPHTTDLARSAAPNTPPVVAPTPPGGALQPDELDPQHTPVFLPAPAVVKPSAPKPPIKSHHVPPIKEPVHLDGDISSVRVPFPNGDGYAIVLG